MLLPLLFSILTFYTSLFEAEEINALKMQAESSFKSNLYLEASKAYSILENKYALKDDEIIFNHATACYKSLQYQTAFQLYKQLTNNKNRTIASQAYNQMGIIACKTGKIKQGREHFKDALRKNGSNNHALRNLTWSYNLFESPNENKKNKNENTQKQNSNKNKQTIDDEFLKSKKSNTNTMSLEKARTILETMKKTEKQFLQQRNISNQKQQENVW